MISRSLLKHGTSCLVTMYLVLHRVLPRFSPSLPRRCPEDISDSHETPDKVHRVLPVRRYMHGRQDAILNRVSKILVLYDRQDSILQDTVCCICFVRLLYLKTVSCKNVSCGLKLYRVRPCLPCSRVSCLPSCTLIDTHTPVMYRVFCHVHI